MSSTSYLGSSYFHSPSVSPIRISDVIFVTSSTPSTPAAAASRLIPPDTPFPVPHPPIEEVSSRLGLKLFPSFTGAHSSSNYAPGRRLPRAGATGAAQPDEVFSSIDVPPFIGSHSVIRDWEDLRGRPRYLPRGLEDRWRTVPPINAYPVEEIAPSEFGWAVGRNLRKVTRLLEKRRSGIRVGEQRQPVFADSRPDVTLGDFMKLCEDEAKEGERRQSSSEGEGDRVVDREVTLNEDECRNASKVGKMLVEAHVRFPSPEEVVDMAADRAMVDWIESLSGEESHRMHCEELLRGTAPHPALDIPAPHGLQDEQANLSDESVDVSYGKRKISSWGGHHKAGRRFLVENKPVMPSNEQDVLDAYRRQSLLQSYKLTRDSCHHKFHFRRLVKSGSIASPHQIATRLFELSAKWPAVAAENKLYGGAASSPPSVIISVAFHCLSSGHLLAMYDVLDCQTLDDLRRAFTFCDGESIGKTTKTSDCYSEFNISGQWFVYCPDSNYSDAITLDGKGGSKTEASRMDSMLLRDHRIPLSAPCYFRHKGNCEHRVIFHSMRTCNPMKALVADGVASRGLRDSAEHKQQQAMITGFDCPYPQAYPVRTFTPMLITQRCGLCIANEPTVLAFNSIDLPRNPTPLCSYCQKHFLMSPTGQVLDERVVFVSIGEEGPQ
eukprot:GHVS01057295.1.p1 GENE.GHVS01057295.1~~GHVS01057295.1.p1  ORF type:complete len:665 (+),score=55.67 GHVS01057295.1:2-1996(+)